MDRVHQQKILGDLAVSPVTGPAFASHHRCVHQTLWRVGFIRLVAVEAGLRGRSHLQGPVWAFMRIVAVKATAPSDRRVDLFVLQSHLLVFVTGHAKRGHLLTQRAPMRLFVTGGALPFGKRNIGR